jgi:hypothetical protein
LGCALVIGRLFHVRRATHLSWVVLFRLAHASRWAVVEFRS